MSDKLEVESSSVKQESVKVAPSGFYYEDVWRPLDGVKMRQFNESSAIMQCLKNKVINMYGDSTVRQWFEYLIAHAPGKDDLLGFRVVRPTHCNSHLLLSSQN